MGFVRRVRKNSSPNAKATEQAPLPNNKVVSTGRFFDVWLRYKFTLLVSSVVTQLTALRTGASPYNKSATLAW